MPRFTIKRLMLTVGLVAGLLGLYRAFGPSLIELVAISLPMTGVVWLVVRRRPRLAAWAFSISSVIANASIALCCAYLYSIGGISLMILTATLMIPLVIGCGSAWAMSRSVTRRLPRPAGWSIVLALVLLPLSMPFTLWPLRVAFALSKPSMERLADRVAAGGAMTAPEWTGLYRIVDAKRGTRSRNVALIIDANPAGRSAFVRVVDSDMTWDGLMINLNFDEPVGGPWKYQNED